MKRNYLAAIACACAFAVFAGAMQTVNVSASLKDGSLVRGDFLTKGITGSTLFAKNLELAPSLVKSVNFTGTNGEAKVELSNGDCFAMRIANDKFAIRSMLGNLKIPRTNFRTLSLSARSAAKSKGGADNGLIFHCTFDDAASITSPAVGPAGTFMTGTFEEGKVGKALMVMPYTKHAFFNLPAGFLNDAGCIEFWAKILKSSPYVGTGGDPRILLMTYADTHEIACNVDIVSNDGGGNSGFAMRTWYGGRASINGMRQLYYADLFSSDWRDWHHYVLVWDKNGVPTLPNSPRVALLIDGKEVTSTRFQPIPEDITRMPSKTPYVLGFSYDPACSVEHNTKSPFLIDEFKIWDYVKTDLFQ